MKALPGVQTIIGFGGYYREDSWTPLLVRLHNRESIIEGTLSIELFMESTSTQPHWRIHTRDIELPQNSRKAFQFFLPLNHSVQKGILKISDSSGILYQEEIPLGRKRITQGIILACSSKPNLDFLYALSPDVMDMRILYPHIDLLPDHWAAYDGVEMIVLHREIGPRLSTAQVEAIKHWAAKGGTLVISGGPGFGKGGALSPLLPLKPEGLGWASSFSSPVTTGSHYKGETLYDYQGIPLVIWNRYGRGVTFFLAFDYANLPPELNQEELWTTIVGSVPETRERIPFKLDNIFSDSYLFHILDVSDQGFPEETMIWVFSLLYLVGTFVILLIIKRKHSFKNFIIVFVFLFVMTALSAFLFLSGANRTNPTTLDIEFAAMDGKSETFHIYKDVLVATPRKISFPFHITNSAGIILPRFQDNLIFSSGKGDTRIDFSLLSWDSKGFILQEAVEATVEGLITRDNGLKHITVWNNGTHLISDGFFLTGGMVYPAGTLLPGDKLDEVFREVPQPATINFETGWEDGLVFPPHAVAKKIAIEHFIQDAAFSTYQSAPILFFGWLQEPIIEIYPERKGIESLSLTLLVLAFQEGDMDK